MDRVRHALRALYMWFEVPHRFVSLRQYLEEPGTRVLDVGCGNHSPSLTKKYFPDCVYYGLDRGDWNNDATDLRAMNEFIHSDLESPHGLDVVQDGAFDVVICSHVLEHIAEPERIAKELASKLKRSGVMYVETPSESSLRLPRAADGWMGIRGCLNFYDDSTHKALVDLRALARGLRADGFLVSRVQKRFLWRRVLLLPAYAAAGLVTRGYIPSSVVWDVTGFAEYVMVRGR